VDFYRQELRSAYSYKYTFANIVGQAPAFVEAKQKALKAAKTSLPVLLVGESGTGKELFAHAIHHASYRREGDFVGVNCADIPPLREREGDVMLLAEHFLQRIGQEQARSLRLSEEAKRALLAHSWPGNVRELLNVLEAASSVAEGDVIGLEDLPSHLRPLRGGGELPTLRDTLLERERETVLAAIRAVGGNMTRAARLLGIHRTGLYKKLRRLGLHNHPELRRLRKV